MRYLPSQPIVERVEARGGLGAVLGSDSWMGWWDSDPVARYDECELQRWRAVYRRMRKSGMVTSKMADRFCMELLDLQPELVYGEDFFEGADGVAV